MNKLYYVIGSFVILLFIFGILNAQTIPLTFKEKTENLNKEEILDLWQEEVIKELQQIRVELIKLNKKK